MTENKKTWNFIKHLLFCVILFLMIKFMSSLLTLRDASAIGIIGAADGPTSIFVSRSAAAAILPRLIPIIIFVLSLGLYRPVKSFVEKRM